MDKIHRASHDPVNKPDHYTMHPSGVECIQITEHMNFTLGNAMKYIWRNEGKNGIEDLKKAIWYIQREIDRRLAQSGPTPDKPVDGTYKMHFPSIDELKEFYAKQK